MSSTTAYIALGFNSPSSKLLNHPFTYALQALESSSPPVTVMSTSYMYSTPPMYKTDQSEFLNAVIKVDAGKRGPLELLDLLKGIEAGAGRVEGGVRNGPRPLDLDIVFYDRFDSAFSHPRLTVPHPRWEEREFVIRPLADLDRTFLGRLGEGMDEATAVVDLGRHGPMKMDATKVWGVINATPDSFSDGGENDSVDAALRSAERMIREGADVLDVGGESTRPGAEDVGPEKEQERVAKVVEAVSGLGVPVSIDTRRACTARMAVEAGAVIVNDVSFGAYDERMFAEVADMDVAYVGMHSRGDPETMKGLAKYGDDVVGEVVGEVQKRREEAERAGIRRWNIITDPGLGFAKTTAHNLQILKEGERFAGMLGGPVLWGGSRKRFIQDVAGVEVAAERDAGTHAAHMYAVGKDSTGGSMVRVHDVAGAAQAAKIWDAIRDAEGKGGGRGKRGKDATAKKPNAVCCPYGQAGQPMEAGRARAMMAVLDAAWNLDDPCLEISRTFACTDYVAAQRLSATVTNLFRNEGHYGEVTVRRALGRAEWNDEVEVKLRTAVLEGLSGMDFQVAAGIDVEGFPIQRLPDGVIQHTLSFVAEGPFNRTDRDNCAVRWGDLTHVIPFVCKAWRAYADSPILWEGPYNHLVSITPEQMSERTNPFPRAPCLANYKKIVAAGRRTLPCFFMHTRTPLPVPLRLHFFEQRYRRLISLTLSTPHKLFVYCPHNSIDVGYQAYMVEVTDSTVYPDGRADVELTARMMCAVEGCFSDNVGDNLVFTKVRELRRCKAVKKAENSAEGGGTN